MKSTLVLPAVGCLFAPAAAAQITPGNLVVVRVGDGSAPLTSVSTAVFYDEYTTAGAFVQSLPLPTSANGTNQPFSNSGSATSEGHLTMSADGRYLVSAGYGSAPGVASIVGTASASVPRVIARVALDGSIDTSTALGDAYSGNNIRSATSLDGSQFWTAGTASTSGGIRYALLGDTVTVAVTAPNLPTNTRTVTIFDGQLYCSSSSGAFQGVSSVGIGLPTTTGEVITLLNGFPTSSGPSAYDHFFADASTLYVADDRTSAGNGGIQKWTLAGGTWSLQYTLSAGTAAGCRGLTGVVDAGVVTLFATTIDNRIVSTVDVGAGSVVGTLVTGAANTALRGIRFVRTSGAVQRLPHACGPTTIEMAGVPAVGNTLRIQLGAATGLPFVGLGFGLAPVAFCGCTVGHDWTSIGFGATYTLAVPNDMIFAGAVFGVQGTDFLGTGGCPAPQLTFTDTLVVTLGS